MAGPNGGVELKPAHADARAGPRPQPCAGRKRRHVSSESAPPPILLPRAQNARRQYTAGMAPSNGPHTSVALDRLIVSLGLGRHLLTQSRGQNSTTSCKLVPSHGLHKLDTSFTCVAVALARRGPSGTAVAGHGPGRNAEASDQASDLGFVHVPHRRCQSGRHGACRAAACARGQTTTTGPRWLSQGQQVDCAPPAFGEAHDQPDSKMRPAGLAQQALTAGAVTRRQAYPRPEAEPRPGTAGPRETSAARTGKRRRRAVGQRGSRHQHSRWGGCGHLGG